MVDAVVSGRLAAEFMSWLVEKGKQVAVFIGNKNFSEHKRKTEGFLEEVRKRNLKIAGVFETQDDPEVAYYMTRKIVRDIPGLRGIYSATGNCAAICRYIKEESIKGISIVGTDIYEELAGYVREGTLHGAIFQDMVRQETSAIRVIYDHMINGLAAQRQIYVTPHLVLKSNIDSYFQHL